MDKYSVNTERDMTKHGSEGECPSCGSALNQQSNPPKCPKCGTEPFETGLERRNQDGDS